MPSRKFDDLLGGGALLLALIVLATVGFVIGVSVENPDRHHEPAAVTTEAGEAGESGGDHGEGAAESPSTETGEFRPLGIDLESTALIVLAAIGSLALAVAGWRRPRARGVLILTAVAMAAFCALDIAEVAHQNDIGETGLAVLAAAVAALHGAAAAVAIRMAATP